MTRIKETTSPIADEGKRKFIRFEDAHKTDTFERGWKRYIKEPNLDRVKKHSENGFLSIAASNAYDKDAHKKNDDEMIELKKILSDAGLEYISLYGNGDLEMNPETGEMIAILEDSLFVPYLSSVMSEEEFIAFAIKTAKYFNQNGFLIKLPSDENIYSYNRKDIEPSADFTEVSNVGKFDMVTLPEMLANGFSMHRLGSKSSTVKFLFEGYRHPHDFYERVSFASRGEILS